jgi:uncharacterized protein YnzC (UPF0291/DUF896 family)
VEAKGMITKELIDKINFLAKKNKAEGLTEEEKEEQALVRRQYIEAVKANVKDTLDRVKFVDEKPSCSCDHTHHEH